MSMPDYCIVALARFRHEASRRMDQPHQHILLAYGTIKLICKGRGRGTQASTRRQVVHTTSHGYMFVLCVIGGLDNMCGTQRLLDQANPTKETMKKTLKFLDYVASHPNTVLTYSTSSMTLNVHSNASYLIKTKAHIQAGGHFSFLTMQQTRLTMGGIEHCPDSKTCDVISS